MIFHTMMLIDLILRAGESAMNLSARPGRWGLKSGLGTPGISV